MPRFIHIAPFSQLAAAPLVQQNAHTVVTPSRLACRAIKAKYQTLRSLALQQVKQQAQVASPIQSQAIFRKVLQAVLQLQPDDCLGMAKTWMPSVKALLESGYGSQPFNTLDSCTQRTHRLLSATAAYQTALHSEGLIDSGELYWRAAESAPEQKPLLIYGYFQPKRGELIWLNRLAASDSIIFLPQSDSELFAQTQIAVDWLIEQGWEVIEGDSATLPIDAPLCQVFLQSDPLQKLAGSVVVHSYGTFEAEVSGTLAAVKALRSAGVPAKEIVIIARDEQAYGPKLLDVAWEYDVPLRALYSTPLLTTRLGAWLQLLLEVLELKFPFEETAKLLSHPLCSNPDSGFWSAARQVHPTGFKDWYDLANNCLALDLSELNRARQERRRDTWVDWLMAILKAFDLRRRCARWARESVAFNNLQKALVEVSKPETEKLSWHEFKQQIEDLLENTPVLAQPGRGGVELHSPVSMMGAQCTHVFVMGMAEGSLPPAVNDDPVLDFFERSHLKTQGINLPSAAELSQKEALDFYFLLQAATGSITFSYSQLKERRQQLPSPYLKRLNIEEKAAPAQPIASLEEQRRVALQQPAITQNAQAPDTQSDMFDPVLVAATHAFEVERDRESAQAANEYDGIIEVPFDYEDWTFSVSQLTMLGQCPFKWFASKVLRLGSQVEAEADLSPSLRGSLYHKVVELLVAAVQAEPTLTQTNADLLREKFLEAEAALEKESGIALQSLPAWEMRRKDHERTLSTVLRKPDFWPEGSEPVALEAQFKGEWQGLQVTGRVDRINKTPDGLTLIDYKTSSLPPKGLKDSNGKASIDLQLQLYREAAAPTLFPGEAVTAAKYFSLTKGEELKISRNAPQHELLSVIENCKTALTAGHYPVQPDIKRDACRYCDFDWVCRQGNRLTRKEN